MRTTRIFKVDYSFVEEINGKATGVYKENRSVTAKDAADAISKVGAMLKKADSFIDDTTKKKVSVTRRNYEPFGVILEAETSQS